MIKYRVMFSRDGGVTAECIEAFSSELDAYGLLEQLQDNDSSAVVYVKAVKA